MYQNTTITTGTLHDHSPGTAKFPDNSLDFLRHSSPCCGYTHIIHTLLLNTGVAPKHYVNNKQFSLKRYVLWYLVNFLSVPWHLSNSPTLLMLLLLQLLLLLNHYHNCYKTRPHNYFNGKVLLRDCRTGNFSGQVPFRCR